MVLFQATGCGLRASVSGSALSARRLPAPRPRSRLRVDGGTPPTSRSRYAQRQHGDYRVDSCDAASMTAMRVVDPPASAITSCGRARPRSPITSAPAIIPKPTSPALSPALAHRLAPDAPAFRPCIPLPSAPRPPTRTSPARPCCRAPTRRRAPGAASARRCSGRRLQMPAMLLTDPFGLASSVTSPAAVA